MKKILITLLILSLPALIHAQIVQQQYSFIGKSTATWCQPCGAWGWNFQEQIFEQCSDKAVVVELYAQSNELFLKSTTASSLVNDFPPSALGVIPDWYVNGGNRTTFNDIGNALDTSTTHTEIQRIVDSAYVTEALANAAYTYTLNGMSLHIDAQTQFFSPTTGDYYLAIYIIEDSVMAPQNGQGSYPTTKVAHNHVLRRAASSNDFGNLITSGSINANQLFNNSFDVTLDSTWNPSHIWLAAVIWKKTANWIVGRYAYINASSDYKTLSGIKSTASIADFKVTTLNPIGQTSPIIIHSVNPLNNVSISIFNVLGRQVSSLFNGSLKEGDNSFMLDSKEMENGLYFLRISTGNKQLVKKLVVQK